MGRLFARFAAVARDNPLATRRQGYSAEEIATPPKPIRLQDSRIPNS